MSKWWKIFCTPKNSRNTNIGSGFLKKKRVLANPEYSIYFFFYNTLCSFFYRYITKIMEKHEGSWRLNLICLSLLTMFFLLICCLAAWCYPGDSWLWIRYVFQGQTFLCLNIRWDMLPTSLLLALLRPQKAETQIR